MDITNLPEECISKRISYTSPKDACRSSLVHSTLRAGADSDAVWEGFLPSDYREIISQSSSPHLNSLSKKKLFFHLCDHPVHLANNIMTFCLGETDWKKMLRGWWRGAPYHLGTRPSILEMDMHIRVQVKFEGTENGSQKREILDTLRKRSQRREIPDTPTNGPQPRNDGWMEIEMGEFFNACGDDGTIVGRLLDFDVNTIKGGLIVEGIEFRPKSPG